MLTDNEIRKFDSPRSGRINDSCSPIAAAWRSTPAEYRAQLGVSLLDKAGVRCKVTIARYPDLRLRAAREERDKLAGKWLGGSSPAHEQKAQRREQKAREQGRGSDPTLSHTGRRNWQKYPLRVWIAHACVLQQTARRQERQIGHVSQPRSATHGRSTSIA